LGDKHLNLKSYETDIPFSDIHEYYHTQSSLTRWKLQRTVQALLPQERVAFCMRRVQSSTVDIMYSPQNQSAHFHGLLACGSVWVCPICAAKISERRRAELELAVNRCIANGGAVYLATYTVSHGRYDTLSDLLASFLAARKRARQGRAAQNLRKQFGILGTVSVREVTWSKLNGWHPHCHELIFCSEEIDMEAYDNVVRQRWQNSAEQFGLSMNDHGFRIDRTHGAVADYVAKFGTEPLCSPWSVTTEMTKSHLKRGRGDEHLTPFALLQLIAQGHDELKPVFLEYAQWFKGKHQLVWSAGLRAKLLMDVEEKSDEEVVQEQEPEEEYICLGSLSHTQWKIVLRYEVRGMLLEIAKRGDWLLIVEFLARLDRRGLSPPFY
jgi:hypothetical protein